MPNFYYIIYIKPFFKEMQAPASYHKNIDNEEQLVRVLKTLKDVERVIRVSETLEDVSERFLKG